MFRVSCAGIEVLGCRPCRLCWALLSFRVDGFSVHRVSGSGFRVSLAGASDCTSCCSPLGFVGFRKREVFAKELKSDLPRSLLTSSDFG